MPYVFAPAAAYAHLMSHYTEYLYETSANDPEKHYIQKFETIGKEMEYDNSFSLDEDELNFFSDEDKQQIAKQIAEDYLLYHHLEMESKSTPSLSSNLLLAEVN